MDLTLQTLKCCCKLDDLVLAQVIVHAKKLVKNTVMPSINACTVTRVEIGKREVECMKKEKKEKKKMKKNSHYSFRVGKLFTL